MRLRAMKLLTRSCKLLYHRGEWTLKMRLAGHGSHSFLLVNDESSAYFSSRKPRAFLRIIHGSSEPILLRDGPFERHSYGSILIDIDLAIPQFPEPYRVMHTKTRCSLYAHEYADTMAEDVFTVLKMEWVFYGSFVRSAWLAPYIALPLSSASRLARLLSLYETVLELDDPGIVWMLHDQAVIRGIFLEHLIATVQHCEIQYADDLATVLEWLAGQVSIELLGGEVSIMPMTEPRHHLRSAN